MRALLHRSTRALATGDEGVTAIEYALIAGLIAVAIAGAAFTVGNSLAGLFGTLVGAF
jgi:pilus assembly protein Flp/PilA